MKISGDTSAAEDVYFLDISPALEAERYLMEHRWRLQRDRKLLDRFTALVKRQETFIFILDRQGRPVRQEPSYQLLEIMAAVA